MTTAPSPALPPISPGAALAHGCCLPRQAAPRVPPLPVPTLVPNLRPSGKA